MPRHARAVRRDANLRRYREAARMRARGHTCAEIGERFGVTAQRAHQLLCGYERAVALGAITPVR